MFRWSCCGPMDAGWSPTGLPGSPAGLPDRRCGGRAEIVKSEHVAYLAETWGHLVGLADFQLATFGFVSHLWGSKMLVCHTLRDFKLDPTHTMLKVFVSLWG